MPFEIYCIIEGIIFKSQLILQLNFQVYERSAEIDKFCCQNCFLRSSVIRSQLETEPLWIRGDQRGNFTCLCSIDLS